MSDKHLRNKIIRLAHQKPELRKHLLPLVTKKLASSKYWNVVWVKNYDKSLADRIKNSSAGKEYGFKFEGAYKSEKTLTYVYKTNMEFAPNMWEYTLIDVTKWDDDHPHWAGEEEYSVQFQHEDGTWTYDSESALLGSLSKILSRIAYTHGI